ncbi:unnamed protein product [Polarella glacialis]|uniref:Uncharacterized protein n=1 Tax=Polarella glacialis TaxID=89957 RepID=A0A813FTY5_POLGL|nr:unnamed protein product [Polarella glacialis]
MALSQSDSPELASKSAGDYAAADGFAAQVHGRSSFCADAEAPKRSLLAAALAAKPGHAVPLGSAMRLRPGCVAVTRARVLCRSESSVRLELLPPELGEPEAEALLQNCRSSSSCSSQCSSTEESRTFHCKVRWRDTGEETAALKLLELLNSLWSRKDLQLCGVPVLNRVYGVVHLGLGASLAEVIPESVSLADLKRNCANNDTAGRVADHLGYHAAKIAVLAATAAAVLASSYILGASFDGDSLRLLPDGALFRTDFAGVFGRGALLDSPPVWLPKAVVVALGSRWHEVQQMAVIAFRIAFPVLEPRPPPDQELSSVQSWVQAQALLLQIEFLLGLPAESYLGSLSASDLEAIVKTADKTVGKRVSSFLHDMFGYKCGSGALLASVTADQAMSCAYRAKDLSAADATALRLKHFVAAEYQQDGDGSVQSLPWASSCPSWPLAVCVVACLSSDVGAAERLLRLHSNGLLAIALAASPAGASSDEAYSLRSGALRSLAALIRHRGHEVRGWLAATGVGGDHGSARLTARRAQFVAELAKGLQELWEPNFAGDFETSLPQEHAATFKLGAVCAIARMELSRDDRACENLPTVSPHVFANFAPALAADGRFAKIAAARTIASLLETAEEEGCRRPLLSELAKHLSGKDLASAVSRLPSGERFAVIRALESLSKASGGSSGCQLARDCLGALAQDKDTDISRPAICAIACAVEDEDENARRWARGFLTEASWDRETSGTNGPVCAFVRMAQDGNCFTPFAADSASVASTTEQSKRTRALKGWNIQRASTEHFEDLLRPEMPDVREDPFLPNRDGSCSAAVAAVPPAVLGGCRSASF